ncbi:MAG: hypothetical protein ACKO2G_11490 [Verrucomicrobiales bacterium]
MPETLSQALRELWNPQYQHVVLLPFLIHGLVLTGLMALGATVLKQTRAGALALLLLALCAGSVFAYLQARGASLTAIQGAHTKYEATEIAAIGERLPSLVWVYYAVAGLALVALVAGLSKPSLRMLFGILAGLAGIGVGLWGLDLHYRESRIYHPNLLPSSVERPNLPTQSPPAAPKVQPARPAQPGGR